MIIVEDLYKKFVISREQKKMGNRHNDKFINAVNGICFNCQPGRIFTLLGPNGAGKTTTLRMIATLLRPSSGSIIVAGFDVEKHTLEVRHKIGFLSGNTKLYDRLTPNEIVKFYADLHHINKNVFNERKEKYFELLGINEFANRYIGKLSNGMRQKVSIVRAIIHDPEIIIFDEPTAGLDIISAKNIIELIQSYKKEGKTLIFSTHNMSEVNLLSDDLSIIHRGKICYNGSYKDFLRKKDRKSLSLEDEFIRSIGDSKL